MLQLQSIRLDLIPLNLKQLRLMAEGRAILENDLALASSDFECSDPEFPLMLDESLHHFIIPHVKAHLKEFQWYTHWLIIERSSNLCIGGIGANGLPDKNGNIMIGYYIDKKSEGLGYASEAVGCFTKWLFEHPRTQAIIADTPIAHIASQKVLGKNNFTLLGEVEEGFRWQLKRMNN
jgi:ribosomal-protein-alanine N-acetyltransferase